jgi:hypothetical protein
MSNIVRMRRRLVGAPEIWQQLSASAVKIDYLVHRPRGNILQPDPPFLSFVGKSRLRLARCIGKIFLAILNLQWPTQF